MLNKCEYCGSLFSESKEKCPHCGAINRHVKRTTDEQPLTIAAFKEWYRKMGLPASEITRFFIGEDYTKPRAFGIYQDQHSGNFIVYMNTDSGKRNIRYEGPDEAYAVNELYMRLRNEIMQQKKLQLKKSGKL